MNEDYVWGLVVGLVVGLLVVAILFLAICSKQGGWAKYDERQKFARGRAWQAAFWTLCAYTLGCGMWDFVGAPAWAQPIASAFIGFILSVTVFIVVCVAKDAYFGLNEKPRFYMILFAIIAGVNILISMINIHDGRMVEDGQITFSAMNLAVAAMFFILFIALGLKALARRKEERE